MAAVITHLFTQSPACSSHDDKTQPPVSLPHRSDESTDIIRLLSTLPEAPLVMLHGITGIFVQSCWM